MIAQRLLDADPTAIEAGSSAAQAQGAEFALARRCCTGQVRVT